MTGFITPTSWDPAGGYLVPVDRLAGSAAAAVVAVLVRGLTPFGYLVFAGLVLVFLEPPRPRWRR